MDFDEFYNLTEGQRMLRRGTITSRPFDRDWHLSQMTAIADYAVHNPWMKQTLGPDIKVQVQASKDGSSLMFVFSKV